MKKFILLGSLLSGLLAGCGPDRKPVVKEPYSVTEPKYINREHTADENLKLLLGENVNKLVKQNVAISDVYNIQVGQFFVGRSPVVTQLLDANGFIKRSDPLQIAAYSVVSLNDSIREDIKDFLLGGGIELSEEIILRTMADFGNGYAYALRNKQGYSGFIYLNSQQLHQEDKPNSVAGISYTYDLFAEQKTTLDFGTLANRQPLPSVPPEFQVQQVSTQSIHPKYLYKAISPTGEYKILYGSLGSGAELSNQVVDINDGKQYYWYNSKDIFPQNADVVLRSAKGVLTQ